MSRTPWLPHAFVPGTLTPRSCVICSRPAGDSGHVVAGESENASVTRPAAISGDPAPTGDVSPVRRRMPAERAALTHKAVISDVTTGGSFSFYITAGVYPDGSLGEVFVRGIGKEGSTVQGLLDAFATMWSIAMQYGAPLDVLARKFAQVKFAPYGPTENPEVPSCVSLIDYIVRWLAVRFGSLELRAELERIGREMMNG